MFIRYQYFRNAIVGLAAVGGLAFCVSSVSSNTEPESSTRSKTTAESSDGDETPSPHESSGHDNEPQGLLGNHNAEPASAGSTDESTAIYARIHETAGAEASSKKVKDLFNGESWKVNLYDDDQDGRWDRAKLDRDRDDSWDEKWNHKDGVWRRDGTDEYWNGKDWVSSGEAAKEADSQPGARPPGSDSPIGYGPDPASREVYELLTGTRADAKKLKDVNNGSGVKINLYDDDEDGRWDRAKLDRERDDSWDEKYTVKGKQVERKVESSGIVYYWRSGAWVIKP